MSRKPVVVESDICVIGSGITGLLAAAKLAEETDAKMVLVEAGDFSTPDRDRASARDRWMAYGTTPWSRDHVPRQNVVGTPHGFSPSMTVGGLAMHWGGVTPRYAPEDFKLRSLFGVGDDWPISYEDLEPFYQEAEERIGISGEQGPSAMDPRSKPFPMPPLPLTYNLGLLKEWMATAGVAMWSQPSAKNSEPYAGRPACERCDTCYPICPTGAKYTPEDTIDRAFLRRVGIIRETLVRRLHADPRTGRITHASANSTGSDPDYAVEFRAAHFVLAAGFAWSPHLLLLSADSSHPTGLANRSGLVGKYLAGHRNIGAQVRLPMRLFPGINTQHSLVSKQFMRTPATDRYLRHDLRVWESSFGQEPRWRGAQGEFLFGDAMLDDWRARTRTGTARLRAYYDVLPARESEITLDAKAKNAFGDPMPRLTYCDAPESVALRGWTEETIRQRFREFARAGGGEIISSESAAGDVGQEHPGGGCRMGSDPATSVVDRDGRSHDHENLFITGAPTHVTASCCNGTLTFAALGLMTAARVAREYRVRRPSD